MQHTQSMLDETLSNVHTDSSANGVAPSAAEPSLLPQAGAAAGAMSPGDDVMRILGDVEDQLNRLRSAQKSQDQAIISLAERAKSLQKSEKELQTARQSIDDTRQALEREREHWEQQRAVHETELHKRHTELESRSADLTRHSGEFDAERQRVAALARQSERRQREFEERSRQLEAEHTQLLHRVESAEKQALELLEQVEHAQQELSLRNEQVAKAAQDAAAFRKRAAAVENSLQQANARIEHLERETTELARQSESERSINTQQIALLSAQLEKSNQVSDLAQQELKSLRERATSLEKTAQQLQAQLTERGTQLEDNQAKLQLAGRKLSEFAKVLAEQTPQLERGAAAMAMVEEQQDQIERLSKELAEHKLRTDPEEVERRDQRIAELTEALRQARGQSAGQAGIAELEHRNAELTSEVNHLKVELENAQIVAANTKKQLEERVDSESSGVAQEAMIAEHAAKIAALTAEIEHLHAQADAELRSKLEAQAQKHQQELSDAHGSDAQTIQAMQERVAELEAKLGEAEKKDGGKGHKPEHDKYAQKLRAKAERITIVADHLRRRRTRLAKMRLLLSERATDAERAGRGRASTEEVLRMENEKAQLAEARQALANSERMMIRKWAAHRATLTTAAVLIIVALCAGAAWLIANAVSPAIVAASVTLEGRTPQRQMLSSDQAESWRAAHNAMLADLDFQQTLAKRLVERRLQTSANPNLISRRIANDLTIEGTDGLLTLTLAGNNPDEVTIMLDTIATTMAMEANRRSSQRPDNASTAIMGERRDGARVQYAKLNPIALRDDRPMYAGSIFLGLLGLSIGAFAFIHGRLAKVRQVFEQDAGTLAVD